MLDWLAIWGVTQAVGFVFRPILEDLAKDAAKDWAGDMFKNSLKNVLHLPKKEPLEIAAGKALKEFLELFQQELQDADVADATLPEYLTPLKLFLKNDAVKTALGAPFQAECVALDTRTLATVWNTPRISSHVTEFNAEPTALQLKTLPPDFDWERVAKRYLRKVRAIRQENEDLRNLLDSQALQEIAQTAAGIAPDFDVRKYRETLQETYGSLKLDSIETSGYAYNELKLWRMFIPQHVRECREYLPQLYDLPKDVQTRLKAEGKLDDLPDEDLSRFRTAYREQAVRPILEIVNAPEGALLLVILGDPGSGKSSLLQYLALDWAEQPPNAAPLLRLPLLIELRRYIRYRSRDNHASVLDFLHAGSAAICHLDQHHLHEWLHAGRALVMFDGLDEVFDPAVRDEVVTEIVRFTNDYPVARVLVTSRIIGYKPPRLRDAGFCHLMLQDLEAAQIDDFITRWHDRTYANDVERAHKAARLRKAISEARPIKQLAGNPLLLTLMAILNRHQELPRDRTELYHQASRLLLHQWDVEGKLLTDPRVEKIALDYRDKQAMLRKVAFFMQANAKGLTGNTIRADDLEKILSDYLKTIEVSEPRTVARIMIEQLRARNFILCALGENYYAFVHRTFLEYFCAWEFVWQFKETRTISLEQLKSDVFGRHWPDESWREVLRLIASMIESNWAGELIDYLSELDGAAKQFENVFLAADLLDEVRNRPAIKASDDRLLERLKTLIKTVDYLYVNFMAANKIASRWREMLEMLPYLKTLIDMSVVRQQAVSAIGNNFKDALETLPYLKTLLDTHEKPEVREAAVWAIGNNFKDTPEILPYLKTLIDTHEKPEVRRTAVMAIGNNFKDAPETLPYLKTLVDTHETPEVRAAAVQAIGSNFTNAPETLPYLQTLVATHEDSEVRQAAGWAIVNNFNDRSEDLPYLKALVDTHEDSEVRKKAVYVIGRNFTNAPETLSYLQTLVATHEDSEVRQAAVDAIGGNFNKKPEILPYLQNLVATHNDPHIQSVAVRSIGEYFGDTAEILAYLKMLIVTHEDSLVRAMAILETRSYWNENAGLVELIFTHLLQDAFEHREIERRQELLKHLCNMSFNAYPDDPRTAEFLRLRAAQDPDERVRTFAQEKLTKLAQRQADAPVAASHK